MTQNEPWQELAKELHDILTLLPNFHAHKDHDVSSETLHQALKDYQLSDDVYLPHLKIRVQNFTRMEIHLFTLVFQQWQRCRGSS